VKWLHPNVPLLSVAQALMMSCNSLMVATAALVGNNLATDKALATLPLAMQFIAVMVTSIPAAMLMQRIGRKAAFLLACGFGVGGGVLASTAILHHNFWQFVSGTFLVGVFNGFGNYFRFTAADSVELAQEQGGVLHHAWRRGGSHCRTNPGEIFARVDRWRRIRWQLHGGDCALSSQFLCAQFPEDCRQA